MRFDQHPADRERGSAAGRVVLSVALAFTVTAIGVGTWVLGSGSDPVQQDRVSSVSDVSSPNRAQPPLSVAPPPAAGSDDDAG